MKRTILSLLAAAPIVFAQAQTYTYSYNGLPLPIYPDDWNTIAVATIFVPRAISISKVTVSVQAQFNGVGNLNIYLYSAAATRTKLLERNCGNLVNVDTTFDDAASSKFSDACPTAGGSSFRGNEPLSNSNGQIALGYWRLAIENNGNGNTGTLSGFSVSITGTLVGAPAIGPNTIVSTSSFLSGAVAPGDQVAIFGVNLGPTTGVRADATKALPTSLGGTSVTFDGTAVPIFYASEPFVVVHAPALNPASGTTQIKVTSSSGSSASIPVTIVPVNPGLFTYEAGGKGQAKAINQDGSINGDGSITGSDKGAPAGSVIQLFATGLGAVSPDIAAGTPAPASPLSLVNGSISATIGGRAATVTYAGAAPGLIGTYQVNVMVPAATPAGAARVALTSGGSSSQDGVTIQVSR